MRAGEVRAALPGAVRSTMMAGLIAALAAGAALAAFHAASHGPNALFATAHQDHLMAMTRPGATATKVSEEKLAHVKGKTVTMQIVDLPPGAFAPEHHHAGSVTVYVLEGTVRSQLAGGPVLDYHPGETFFEPIGTVHLFAENPSLTEPAKFMAVHVADDGAQLTVYH
jgi:quercetin dioxygenase-like cupin family protein